MKTQQKWTDMWMNHIGQYPQYPKNKQIIPPPPNSITGPASRFHWKPLVQLRAQEKWSRDRTVLICVLSSSCWTVKTGEWLYCSKTAIWKVDACNAIHALDTMERHMGHAEDTCTHQQTSDDSYSDYSRPFRFRSSSLRFRHYFSWTIPFPTLLILWFRYQDYINSEVTKFRFQYQPRCWLQLQLGLQVLLFTLNIDWGNRKLGVLFDIETNLTMALFIVRLLTYNTIFAKRANQVQIRCLCMCLITIVTVMEIAYYVTRDLLFIHVYKIQCKFG